MNVLRKPLRPACLLTWVGLVVPFLLFSIVPLAWMAAQALCSAAPSKIFGDLDLCLLLGRTVAFSLTAAGIATLLGGIAGYLLGSASWRGKGLARIILILPLAIPPYLHAIGWTTLLRPRGWVAASISFLLGITPSQISEAVYSFFGATLVLALAYFPIAMLFCEKSLALSSPALREAARVFGANRWQVFWVARWPFLRSAIASSAMVILLLAASDLGVPTIFKVPVFNFEVFTQLGAFNDVTAATLLAMPLFVVGVSVLAFERRFTVGGDVQPDARDIQPPQPASPARAHFNRAFFAVLAVTVLGLPISAIAVHGARADAFVQMARLAIHPAANTIGYAGCAAVLVTLIAFAFAWMLRTTSRVVLRLTDWILVVGFAVPGTIVALALLAVFDRPGVFQLVTPVMLVVAALVVRYTIVGYRIAAGAMAQIPSEIFDAAALDGAGAIRMICYVFLPLARVALLAALAVAFILSVGEIGSTILLYPPGGETLPITLYAIEANSPRSYVAALTLIQLLVSLAPVALVTMTICAASRWTSAER